MTTESLLMLVSASIIALLGSGHLILTFRGPKLLPRDETVREAMEGGSPVITTQTTIWRAWIGFNASHSMGAILFGLVYGFLAVARGDVLFQSTFLQLVGLVMLVGYVVLAKLYWFVTPLVGTTLSLVCFVASIWVSRV